MLPTEYEVGTTVKFNDDDDDLQDWVVTGVTTVTKDGKTGAMITFMPEAQTGPQAKDDEQMHFTPPSVKDMQVVDTQHFTREISDGWPKSHSA